MTNEPKKSSPFVTVFIPGVLLGLVIGADASAFLLPMLEQAGVGVDSKPTATTSTSAPRDRDVPSTVPPKADQPVAPTDPKADEPKPTEPKAADPTAPAQPADPSTAPKPAETPAPK